MAHEVCGRAGFEAPADIRQFETVLDVHLKIWCLAEGLRLTSELNQHCRYRIRLDRDLLGDWAVAICYGPIGEWHVVFCNWFSENGIGKSRRPGSGGEVHASFTG
jgi:hypothetical protein